MLIIDVNNLLHRYFYMNKDKDKDKIMKIIFNQIENLKRQLSLKNEEVFFCFDPFKIEDKTLRYKIKPDYKNNQLQKLLFDFKLELAHF